MSSTARTARVASLALVLLTASLLGCPGSGNIPTRLSGQIVGEAEQPLGPRLLMIEAGHVHDGAYILGAHINEYGRFSVDLPGAGTYGLHLFVDGYQYLPAEIVIEEHQQIVLTSPMIAWGVWMDLTGQHAWPTQPDDATLTRMPTDETVEDNPVLEGITAAWTGEFLEFTADVSDPDDDLSRMVLMWDETTKAGYALVPPEGPDDRNNYPQGTWEMSIYADELHEPGSMMRFVVSDNLCNDTPIVYVPLPER